MVGIMGTAGVVFIFAALKLRRSIASYLFRDSRVTIKTQDTPTVSVCIPARNEVHAMTACLERVLASNYDKLEIIVLDDESADNTSVLIKSFAHAGVRFVEGRPLPDGWMGKSHALQGLLDAASGTYIVFMDVDTRIETNTISHLVEYARASQVSYVSVMPQRQDGLRMSVLFGTLRYFWTLLLDTRRRPATSGAFWLVDRQKLQSSGGFHANKSSIRPEYDVVSQLNIRWLSQFLISTKALGVMFEKRWSSQAETSVRLMTQFIPSMLAQIAVATSILLYIGSIIATVTGGYASTLAGGVAIISIFALVMLFTQYYRVAWSTTRWPVALLVLPYKLIQEAIVIIISIIQTKRNALTWKGRHVSLRK